MSEPVSRGKHSTDPGTSKLSGSSLGQDFANPGTTKLGTGSAASLDPLSPHTTNLGSGSGVRATLDPNTSKLGGSSGSDYPGSSSTPAADDSATPGSSAASGDTPDSLYYSPSTPSSRFGDPGSRSTASDPFASPSAPSDSFGGPSAPSDPFGRPVTPSDPFGSPYASPGSTETPASPYASPGGTETPASPYASPGIGGAPAGPYQSPGGPSVQASPYASPGTPGGSYADQGAPGTPYPYPSQGSPSAPGNPYAGQAGQGAPPYPSQNSPYNPGGGFGGASPYSPYGGPSSPFPQNPPRTSGLAIASLVLGLFGIFIITAVLSLIFGFVGLSKIRRTGQTGKGMAIAGIILSAAWIILVIALGIASSNQAQRSANGQINKGGSLSVLSLKSGDCFAYPTDQQAINTVTAIPCNQAHDAQVFAQFNLSGSSSSYPSNMTQLASNGCQARTASLNKSLLTSSMSMKIVYPQNASWITGNRTVNCVMYSPTNLSTSLLNS